MDYIKELMLACLLLLLFQLLSVSGAVQLQCGDHQFLSARSKKCTLCTQCGPREAIVRQCSSTHDTVCRPMNRTSPALDIGCTESLGVYLQGNVALMEFAAAYEGKNKLHRLKRRKLEKTVCKLAKKYAKRVLRVRPHRRRECPSEKQFVWKNSRKWIKCHICSQCPDGSHVVQSCGGRQDTVCSFPSVPDTVQLFQFPCLSTGTDVHVYSKKPNCVPQLRHNAAQDKLAEHLCTKLKVSLPLAPNYKSGRARKKQKYYRSGQVLPRERSGIPNIADSERTTTFATSNNDGTAGTTTTTSPTTTTTNDLDTSFFTTITSRNSSSNNNINNNSNDKMNVTDSLNVGSFSTTAETEERSTVKTGQGGTDTDTGSFHYTILAVCGGGLVLCITCLLSIVYLFRRRRKKQPRQSSGGLSKIRSECPDDYLPLELPAKRSDYQSRHPGSTESWLPVARAVRFFEAALNREDSPTILAFPKKAGSLPSVKGPVSATYSESGYSTACQSRSFSTVSVDSTGSATNLCTEFGRSCGLVATNGSCSSSLSDGLSIPSNEGSSAPHSDTRLPLGNSVSECAYSCENVHGHNEISEEEYRPCVERLTSFRPNENPDVTVVRNVSRIDGQAMQRDCLSSANSDDVSVNEVRTVEAEHIDEHPQLDSGSDDHHLPTQNQDANESANADPPNLGPNTDGTIVGRSVELEAREDLFDSDLSSESEDSLDPLLASPSSNRDSLSSSTSRSSAASIEISFPLNNGVKPSSFSLGWLHKDQLIPHENVLWNYSASASTQTDDPGELLPRPLFSSTWQGKKSLSSAGGSFQLPNSDVRLEVPANAVPPAEFVDVVMATYTNLAHVRAVLELAQDQYFVSPVVELFAGKGFCFAEPVQLYLPNALLTSIEEEHINVHHFDRADNGDFVINRLPSKSEYLKKLKITSIVNPAKDATKTFSSADPILSQEDSTDDIPTRDHLTEDERHTENSGETNVSAASLPPSPDARSRVRERREESYEVDLGYYELLPSGVVRVTTTRFCGFTCTVCRQYVPGQPQIHLVATGSHQQVDWDSWQAQIRLALWDRKIETHDFQRDYLQGQTVVGRQVLHTVENFEESLVKLDLTVYGPSHRSWQHALRPNSTDSVLPVSKEFPLKELLHCNSQDTPRFEDWLVENVPGRVPGPIFQCIIDVVNECLEECTEGAAATAPSYKKVTLFVSGVNKTRGDYDEWAASHRATVTNFRNPSEPKVTNTTTGNEASAILRQNNETAATPQPQTTPPPLPTHPPQATAGVGTSPQEDPLHSSTVEDYQLFGDGESPAGRAQRGPANITPAASENRPRPDLCNGTERPASGTDMGNRETHLNEDMDGRNEAWPHRQRTQNESLDGINGPLPRTDSSSKTNSSRVRPSNIVLDRHGGLRQNVEVSPRNTPFLQRSEQGQPIRVATAHSDPQLHGNVGLYSHQMLDPGQLNGAIHPDLRLSSIHVRSFSVGDFPHLTESMLLTGIDFPQGRQSTPVGLIQERQSAPTRRLSSLEETVSRSCPDNLEQQRASAGQSRNITQVRDQQNTHTAVEMRAEVSHLAATATVHGASRVPATRSNTQEAVNRRRRIPATNNEVQYNACNPSAPSATQNGGHTNPPTPSSDTEGRESTRNAITRSRRKTGYATDDVVQPDRGETGYATADSVAAASRSTAGCSENTCTNTRVRDRQEQTQVQSSGAVRRNNQESCFYPDASLAVHD